MSRPTGPNQKMYEEESFTREEIMDLAKTAPNLPKALTVEIIGAIVSGIATKFAAISVFGGLITVTMIMAELDADKKKRLVNDLLEKAKTQNTVRVEFEFRSYRKGSQGYFWLPTDRYKVY